MARKFDIVQRCKIDPNLEFFSYQDQVQEAEAMYRRTIAWRKQKCVDLIMSWNPPIVLRKYYPGGFAGFDVDGCPVWIIPFGHADMKG